jgi:hypothetical protein
MSRHVGKNMRSYSKLHKRHNFGATVDKQVRTEFEYHDVEATIKTMVVPVLTRGTEFDNIYYISYISYFQISYESDDNLILVLYMYSIV